MGHVRDLPKKRVAVRVPGVKKSAAKPRVKGARAEPRGIEIAGVDIAQGFHPSTKSSPPARRSSTSSRRPRQGRRRVFLAADPDREGEAICWHLAEELRRRRSKKVQAGRLQRDHQEGGRARPSSTRPTSTRRRSTRSRRAASSTAWSATSVSPILWEKVERGARPAACSRWRCGSSATASARSRRSSAEEYWTVAAHLERRSAAALPREPAEEGRQEPRDRQRRRGGGSARRPGGGDLPRRQGRSPRSAAATRCRPSSPRSCSRKRSRSCASASRRRCRWRSGSTRASSSALTAAVGLITYMRTDSTRVSNDALDAVRGRIGSDLRRRLPSREAELLQVARRTRRTRTRPSAPPYLRARSRSRSSSTCRRTSCALYSSIWNRFVASQMKPAVYDETIVDIECRGLPAARQGLDA